MNGQPNLMIDLETIGTKPGCSIISIAVVPFGFETDVDSYYKTVSRESCAEAGLKEDPKTLEWWAKQSIAARAEAFSGTLRIETVLTDLYTYISQFRNPLIWGNGAAFDAPILKAAYDICCIKAPWVYGNERCYRTLSALFPQVPRTKPAVAHNALDDAMSQAAHAEMILNWIGRGKS